MLIGLEIVLHEGVACSTIFEDFEFEVENAFTIKDIQTYAERDVQIIGEDITYVQDVNIGEETYSGDIALVKFNDFDPSTIICSPTIVTVFSLLTQIGTNDIVITKTGASTGTTDGRIGRPPCPLQVQVFEIY